MSGFEKFAQTLNSQILNSKYQLLILFPPPLGYQSVETIAKLVNMTSFIDNSRSLYSRVQTHYKFCVTELVGLKSAIDF